MTAVTVVSQVESVLALRGSMTLPELQAHVSAEKPKTENAVKYLRSIGRLQSAGIRDGHTFYELSDIGKRHIQEAKAEKRPVQAEGAPAATNLLVKPKSSSVSMQDLAFPDAQTPRRGRPRVDRSAVVATITSNPATGAVSASPGAAKVGMLDSGELILILDARPTILPVAVVDRIRDLLT